MTIDQHYQWQKDTLRIYARAICTSQGVWHFTWISRSLQISRKWYSYSYICHLSKWCHIQWPWM